MTFGGLFQIFGGDRVVHHVSSHLPNSNLYICPVNYAFQRPVASSRLRKHLGSEAFAGLHHRPENPGQLVG
jgi:hypothetical protein